MTHTIMEKKNIIHVDCYAKMNDFINSCFFSSLTHSTQDFASYDSFLKFYMNSKTCMLVQQALQKLLKLVSSFQIRIMGLTF